MARKVTLTYLNEEGVYTRYEAPDPVSVENMTAIIALMDGTDIDDIAAMEYPE